MLVALLDELKRRIVAHLALTVVHGGNLQDHGQVTAGGDGDGVGGDLHAQDVHILGLRADAVVGLPGIPVDDVHHQVDLIFQLDGAHAEELGHIQETDATKLHIVLEHGQGPANQAGAGDLLDLHAVVGDEAVAAFEELDGGLALADAAFAHDEHALAVDLHEDAVAADPGRQLGIEVGGDGGDQAACGHLGAQEGDIVLLGHLQAFRGGNAVAGEHQGGELVGKEPVVDGGALGGGHLVQVADLGVAQDLQAHGLEMIIVPRKLKAGTGYIRHGELDVFKIRGGERHLQVEFVDHRGQGNAVSFDQDPRRPFAAFYDIIPVWRGNINPKNFFEKTEKNACFFSHCLLLYSSACDRRTM